MRLPAAKRIEDIGSPMVISVFIVVLAIRSGFRVVSFDLPADGGRASS